MEASIWFPSLSTMYVWHFMLLCCQFIRDTPCVSPLACCRKLLLSTNHHLRAVALVPRLPYRLWYVLLDEVFDSLFGHRPHRFCFMQQVAACFLVGCASSFASSSIPRPAAISHLVAHTPSSWGPAPISWRTHHLVLVNNAVVDCTPSFSLAQQSHPIDVP